MWINTFDTLSDGFRARHFFEPLNTVAPAEAHPYCCYARTIIFYKHLYDVEWDRVETQWDLLGKRFTPQDLGWSSLSPLVLHDMTIYRLGGGSVIRLLGRWVMCWHGFRLHDDDLEMRAGISDQLTVKLVPWS